MVLVIATAAFAGQYDILIAHCDPGSTSGVQTYIAGDPFYDSVDFVDCTTQTPTVATMLDYGCVYTWSNYQYQNASQMGNNLADYVDAYGTVVISDFGWTAGWGLQGRIMTDADYAPMTHNGSGAYTYTNLGDYDDTHPFMDDVTSITNIFYWTYVSKEAPADWVADNTSGNILCAVKRTSTLLAWTCTPVTTATGPATAGCSTTTSSGAYCATSTWTTTRRPSRT
jgi:hypothetical protein